MLDRVDHRAQRERAELAARSAPEPAGAGASSSPWRAVARGGRDLPVPARTPGRDVPRGRSWRRRRRPVNDADRLGRRRRPSRHAGGEGLRHLRPAQPAGGPARRVAVVADGRRPRWRSRRSSAGSRAARRRPCVCLAVILGTGLWNDVDGDAGHDPGRHRAGHAPRRRRRGAGWAAADGPTPAIRPVLDALADDARRSSTWCPAWRCSAPSRFTAIVAAVVYAAPGRDQDRRRRHPRRVGRPPSRPPSRAGIDAVADDPQGPAADGARRAGARRQPGPAVRAVDGRHRRPRRRRRLGFLVVAGFAQREVFGKGLAAGIAIMLWA